MSEREESTDCLVVEIYSDDSNKVFIVYDYYDKSYVIKGLNNYQSHYSFRCRHINDIRNFIEFLFCYQNELTVLLHNYKSLPYDCNDIEFESLNDLFDTNPYEGNILVSKKMNLTNRICFTIIEEQLKVIKNIYNKY
jgi:hypothetical protein